MSDLSAFEKTIGYKFNNISLLKTAVTHSSYANELKSPVPYNERLEFLGDSVLSIIVSDYLFNNFRLAEGDLTKLRASIVCEKSLYAYAQKINLGSYIMLGRGEEQTGGRERPSILADAVEAVIAAIYLDGGIENAKKFVLPIAETILNNNEPAFKDYKTVLQEIIQKNPEERVTYVLTDEYGPDHDKRFVVEVHLNSNVIGRGEGRSKKNAEQMAAKEALELMGR
ncbi:MAG TPA: ribonuclease III [Ruminococcaceae bacterium]|nr:ribonuclease III [Oscillospiraceae bacterium]